MCTYFPVPDHIDPQDGINMQSVNMFHTIFCLRCYIYVTPGVSSATKTCHSEAMAGWANGKGARRHDQWYHHTNITEIYIWCLHMLIILSHIIEFKQGSHGQGKTGKSQGKK